MACAIVFSFPVERILNARSITAASPMAPACGLYLGHVKYELLWIHGYREISPSSETWYYLLWNAPIHELGIVRTIIYGISWIVQRDAGTSSGQLVFLESKLWGNIFQFVNIACTLCSSFVVHEPWKIMALSRFRNLLFSLKSLFLIVLYLNYLRFILFRGCLRHDICFLKCFLHENISK